MNCLSPASLAWKSPPPTHSCTHTCTPMHTQAHTGSQLKFFETEAAEASEGCRGQESVPCVIGCAAGPLCEILPGSLKRKPQIAQLNEIYSKKQGHSELPVQVGMRPWQSSGGCRRWLTAWTSVSLRKGRASWGLHCVWGSVAAGAKEHPYPSGTCPVPGGCLIQRVRCFREVVD